MSNLQQQFRAGETKGDAQAKTEHGIKSAKDTANAACDKTAQAAHSTQQSAHESGQPGGFLEQTGDKIMNAAQGAVDSIKNAINK